MNALIIDHKYHTVQYSFICIAHHIKINQLTKYRSGTTSSTDRSEALIDQKSEVKIGIGPQFRRKVSS